MKVQSSATDLLRILIRRRGWYKDAFEKAEANDIEKRLSENSITENEAAHVIIMLGWQLQEPPVWLKTTSFIKGYHGNDEVIKLDDNKLFDERFMLPEK